MDEHYQQQLMRDDFTQCMYMLRHYDSMNWEITKYTITEMLVSIGACWTIYNWSKPTGSVQEIVNGLPIIAIICFASFLFGLLSLFLIGKNRSYFALTSRHINEYRKSAIENNLIGFENKAGYWTNYSFPKTFDPTSTQMLCFYLVALFSVSMLGFGTYALLESVEYATIWISVGIPLIVLVLIISLAKILLK